MSVVLKKEFQYMENIKFEHLCEEFILKLGRDFNYSFMGYVNQYEHTIAFYKLTSSNPRDELLLYIYLEKYDDSTLITGIKYYWRL